MCSQGPNEESYEFFEDIDKYINYEEKIKSNTTNEKITECCTSLMKGGQTLKNTEKSKDICVNFLKLYEILPNVKVNNAKDWGFLNYWLNFELGQINKNICVNELYDEMESQCNEIIIGISLNVPMHNVNKVYLNKMSLLYGLYQNYKKLNDILNVNPQNKPDSLLEPSTKCCSDYIKADYFCKGENSKFCTQLGKFKKMYEELYTKLNGKSDEYSKNFIKLTQCENTNIMSTALIGTTVGVVPLLVGLYKFTPLGQLFNPNKRKFTQEYRSNDDMTNIMLMDKESERISSQQGRYNIKYHSV